MSFKVDGRARREYIAWLLIVVLTALIVIANGLKEPSKDGVRLQTVASRFRALVLIATQSMEKRLGMAGDKRLALQLSTAVQQAEQEARTPEDKFHVAILAGEIIGKERALTLLDSVTPEGSPEIADDIATARRVYTIGSGSLDPAVRQGLIQRHGDFGKILLSYGVAPGNEPRKSVEEAANRSLAAASFVGFTVLVLALLSITLFVLGVVFWLKEKIQPAYISTPAGDSRFLEAFAVYLIGLTGLGLLLAVLRARSLGWNLLVIIIPVALLLWIGRQRNLQDVFRAVGWHRGRGFWREVVSGLTAYVGSLVLIVPSALITYVLVRISGSDASHPIMSPLLMGDLWQLLTLYVLACVVAPVTEETMFRGILFHHLRGRWSWLMSAIAVSLLFAIIHPQGWAAVPALGMIAFVLCGIREWRDSLIGSMAAHSLNNFLALTFALLLLR